MRPHYCHWSLVCSNDMIGVIRKRAGWWLPVLVSCGHMKAERTEQNYIIGNRAF